MRKPNHNKPMSDELEPSTLSIFLESNFRKYDIRKVLTTGKSLDYKAEGGTYHLSPELQLTLKLSDNYVWSKQGTSTVGPCPAAYWSKRWNEFKEGIADIRAQTDTLRQAYFVKPSSVPAKKGILTRIDDPIMEMEKLVNNLYRDVPG